MGGPAHSPNNLGGVPVRALILNSALILNVPFPLTRGAQPLIWATVAAAADKPLVQPTGQPRLLPDTDAHDCRGRVSAPLCDPYLPEPRRSSGSDDERDQRKVAGQATRFQVAGPESACQVTLFPEAQGGVKYPCA